MINENQIKFYIDLNDDVDMYQRLGDTENKLAILKNDDWALLDNLAQRFKISQNNLVSNNYLKETDKLIKKILRILMVYHYYKIMLLIKKCLGGNFGSST